MRRIAGNCTFWQYPGRDSHHDRVKFLLDLKNLEECILVIRESRRREQDLLLGLLDTDSSRDYRERQGYDNFMRLLNDVKERDDKFIMPRICKSVGLVVEDIL